MPLGKQHHLLQWWYTHWTWIFWFVVVVVAARMVVWWFRTSSRGRGHLAPRPEEILKLRYNCGELDKTEYQRRLNLLRRMKNRR